MTQERVVKLTRHSLLTSMALDVLGFALSTKTQRDTLSWFVTSKTIYPAHTKSKKLTSRGSYFSDCLVAILQVFSEVNPVECEDLENLADDVGLALSRIKTDWGADYYKDHYSAHLMEPETTPISLILGCACAYYCALVGNNLQFLFEAYTEIANIFGFTDREYRCGMALAIILYRLYYTGWFGHDSMEELLKFDIVRGILHESITKLMQNCLEGAFLARKVDANIVEGLIYPESVLWQALFYMTRVSTAYPREIVRSLPREQLPEIMVNKITNPTDVAFVFGAICTVSEPNYHPLVNKHLRESSVYVQNVDEILRYLG